MQEYVYHFDLMSSLVAGLVPLVLGWIWYGPLTTKIIGAAPFFTRIQAIKSISIPLALCLAYIVAVAFAYLLDAGIEFSHYHPELEVPTHSDHTFSHGAIHGIIFSIVFMAIPTFIYNRIRRRCSWVEMIVHILYLISCISIMGGIVDAWN